MGAYELVIVAVVLLLGGSWVGIPQIPTSWQAPPSLPPPPPPPAKEEEKKQNNPEAVRI